MTLVIQAIEDTILKKSTKHSSELDDGQMMDVRSGKRFPIEDYEEAENGHYKVVLGYEAGTWYIWGPHWDLPWDDHDEDDQDPFEEFLTPDICRKIMREASAEDIATYVDPLNKVMYKYDISTGVRVAAFIAQIAHESGQLRYKEEIASGEAYEGRRDLGNVRSGDGKRYKGRGLIQLTGRANYRQAGKAMNLPLEDDPEMAVRDPYINAAIAGWYWQSRNINAAADREDFKKVTRLINGGLNGYEDRQLFWERAKQVLSSGSEPSSQDEIDWDNFNAKVSRYFTVREVTNGERRRIPHDEQIKANIITLAQELDKVREQWGSAILVNSWYRPPAVNKAVGGASNSQHIYGKAADIRPAQGNLYDFQDWLDNEVWTNRALGYGAKKGFVHLDLRLGKIRWYY